MCTVTCLNNSDSSYRQVMAAPQHASKRGGLQAECHLLRGESIGAPSFHAATNSHPIRASLIAARTLIIDVEHQTRDCQSIRKQPDTTHR